MISIRRVLLLVCLLLVMGPLVLIWAWPQARALEREFEQVREFHLLVAKTMAQTLERYHTDLLGIFSPPTSETAGSIAPSAMDPAVLRALNVRYTAIVERDSGVLIRGADGLARAPTGPMDAGLLESLKDIATDNTPGLTGVRFDHDGIPAIFIVRTVGQQLLVGVVDTSYLAKLGSSITFGNRGHAVIIDQNGRALAHPDPAWVRKASDLSGLPIVKRVRSGEAGVATFFSPAFKTDMIAAFTPVPGTGWSILVPQPLSELREAASSVRQHFFTVFLVGLLIAALIAIRAGIIITAPLDRLNDSARKMAHGDLDVRVETGGALMPHELGTLTTTFNDMAAKLSELRDHGIALREQAEKASASKSNFMRTVTHELRSPVNAIVGFSDLLTGRHAANLSPEARDGYLRDISAGGRHLLSLVNDLLDLARAESGQYQLIEDVFWLDEITHRASRYVEMEARERNVSVEIIIHGEPPSIRGDERALFQALLNLVNNAVRYGRRGGIVTIDVGRPAWHGVDIVVSDDGPGIAPDDLARVMLPFERAHNAHSEPTRGSGLGLPIVRQIAELHGGSFELTSVLGQGTRARITLPASRVGLDHESVAVLEGVIAKAA
jgi:signal transduction histidine kinase